MKEESGLDREDRIAHCVYCALPTSLSVFVGCHSVRFHRVHVFVFFFFILVHSSEGKTQSTDRKWSAVANAPLLCNSK